MPFGGTPSKGSALAVGSLTGINKKDLLTAGNGNPTDLFKISVANSSAVGGKVIYDIFATDATDFQSLSGEFSWAAVADGAGAVSAASQDSGPLATAVTNGTLTEASGTTTTTNFLTVTITGTSSLSPTILNIVYTIVNNSDGLITIL